MLPEIVDTLQRMVHGDWPELDVQVQVTDDGLPQPGRVASLNRDASPNAQREIQRFLRAPTRRPRTTVYCPRGLFPSGKRTMFSCLA